MSKRKKRGPVVAPKFDKPSSEQYVATIKNRIREAGLTQQEASTAMKLGARWLPNILARPLSLANAARIF